jgi:hypothetical protein
MEKKKTFKELFAGTGIEPTTDENGGVHYNFNATLKKEPMNKEFIPYEQALELKELGFDEECLKKQYHHENDLVNVHFPNDLDCQIPLYQQAFRWFRNQYITKRSINERGDYIEGNFFMLPLIFPNGYEIKLLKQSTSYTIVGGREIPFYAEPEAVYKETTESYESAELACLKKLIEIVKNK